MYEPLKFDELQAEAIRRAEQARFEGSMKKSELSEREARLAAERRAEAAEKKCVELLSRIAELEKGQVK